MTEAGYTTFEFDLPSALIQKLTHTLDEEITAAELTLENLSKVPEGQGIYQLLLNDLPVYVRKTDTEAGLHKRLEDHFWKTQHRNGLQNGAVKFKAVRIYVFTAMDLETQLIRIYSECGHSLWNGSGFGAHDPGRERDTTNIKQNHFDMLYPIDCDIPLQISFKGKISAHEALLNLKRAIPYVLRFETAPGKSRKCHPDLENTTIEFENRDWTARSLLAEITRKLPSGWQSTIFPGWLILYKENRPYKFGQILQCS
jgi:hypothetical protein